MAVASPCRKMFRLTTWTDVIFVILSVTFLFFKQKEETNKIPN